MRLIGGALLALVLTGGCTGAGEGAGSDAPRATHVDKKTSAPHRTLLAVAKAVCGDKPIKRVEPEETERPTGQRARCGGADVWLFDSASGRDAWVKIASGFRPVLVGTNWAVASQPRILQEAKPELGGRIVWPGPEAGHVDANADQVEDYAYADIDCSEVYTRDDERLLLRDCLANGGH
jgi:hypothetical protein